MIETLTPWSILAIVLGYFFLLMVVAHFTSRKVQSNDNFFLAERKSPWIVVAIGMIGATLSGVTFISVPGWVGQVDTTTNNTQGFAYMQMVMGYILGYFVIATVLLPLYYRMGLTSIYEYLEERFGKYSYKVGAAYFLLSRVIGASFRLFIVASVMQEFVSGPLGVPFPLTVAIAIILIWVYTFRGGIKTIVYTDTLQTISIVGAVILTIIAVTQALETDISGAITMIKNSSYGNVFFFDGGWSDPYNFWKQFLAGALMAIVMTGLDQDMMQKNLSCPTVRDSQKNMFVFTVILVLANILFLSLGALLYLYAAQIGLTIPERSDHLFPFIALNELGAGVGIVFIVGLIAAAYSSADSALTALTTSFCVDFLNFNKDEESTEDEKKRTRFYVHIGFSVLLLLVIVAFEAFSTEAVIKQVFLAAGYTYGPLLGLFSFGMMTNLKIREILDLGQSSWGSKLPWFLQKINLVVIICLASPILCYIINTNSKAWFYGFEFGFLIIALNGLLTFLGLLAISYFDFEAHANAEHNS